MRHKTAISLFLVFILAVSTSAFSRENPLDRELSRLTEKVVLDMNAAGEARVAFLDFVDLDGKTTRFGRFVVEELRTRFYSTKRFTVVERRSMDAVLEEQKLQLSGLISEDSVVDIGKLVGANALVTGHIADLGDEVRILVRLVSVDSATVFSVARATIPKDEMVAGLMGETLVEAPLEQTAQGTGLVIQRSTQEEVEAMVQDTGGEMSGSWLLDSTIAMSLVQRGDEIIGKYDRGAGTIRGKVEGRVISFRWSEDAQRKDGSLIMGTGEMTLSEDGMMLSGISLWANGRSREKWVAIRSRTDPRVVQLVTDAKAYRRGLWDGLWIANNSEELELYQSGNKVTANWNDGGAVLYGFARSHSLSFYKIYPSSKQDSTLRAVYGEVTLSEDEMRFDGLTRWARGNTQGHFNGVRSNADALVEEHIDAAKRGRRGRFAGRWLVNDTEALRLYQNDELLYGRWAGSRDELWGFVRGATIDFYEVREAPARDGTL
ncbi:MAG: FlgO family outer membrane protein, partial [Spirochaetota bacterium]